MRLRPALLALLALAIATPSVGGEAKLTETSVRDFVARQGSAWNAKDARAFSNTFAPDALFVDQARDSHGGLTRNGESTLSQATSQARRFFLKNRFRETEVIDQVQIAADGQSANIRVHEITRIEAPGRAPQLFCAQTEQTVTLRKGRILSHGQTDTDVRCSR